MASYLDYQEVADKQFRRNICFLARTLDDFRPDQCIKVGNGKPNILLLGDSHAAQYYKPMTEIFPKYNISQITAVGCRGVLPPVDHHVCYDLMRLAFSEYIPNNHFDAIIIAGLWLPGDMIPLNKTIDYIARYTSNIYVFGSSIRYAQKLPRMIASSYLSGRRGKIFPQMSAYAPLKDDDVEMQQELDKHATYISTIDAICPDSVCVTQIDGVPSLFDDSHMTDVGAAYTLRHIFPNGEIPIGNLPPGVRSLKMTGVLKRA